MKGTEFLRKFDYMQNNLQALESHFNKQITYIVLSYHPKFEGEATVNPRIYVRTYQNKNLEAVLSKLCTLQLRTCFSLMKNRFLLQGLQS